MSIGSWKWLDWTNVPGLLDWVGLVASRIRILAPKVPGASIAVKKPIPERVLMLDNDGWSKLLDALISATASSKLIWEQVQSGKTDGLSVRASILGGLSYSKIFRATAPSQTQTYELKCAEDLGRALYELSIGERSSGPQGGGVGTLRSVTNWDVVGSYALNHKLEQLFKAVDATIESSGEVLARLLQGLGE